MNEYSNRSSSNDASLRQVGALRSASSRQVGALRTAAVVRASSQYQLLSLYLLDFAA